MTQCVLVTGDIDLCRDLTASLAGLACSAQVKTRYAKLQSASILLSNKYYEADVTLLPCAFTELKETIESLKQVSSIQGIILAAQEGCSKAQRRLEELTLQHEGSNIRLLAVNVSTSTSDGSGSNISNSGEWQRRMQRVCVEHCTEFCAVCLADKHTDQQLHDSEDEQGLQRVLQALEAHLWPHMRLTAAAGGTDASHQRNSATTPAGSTALQDAQDARSTAIHTAHACVLDDAQAEQSAHMAVPLAQVLAGQGGAANSQQQAHSSSKSPDNKEVQDSHVGADASTSEMQVGGSAGCASDARAVDRTEQIMQAMLSMRSPT